MWMGDSDRLATTGFSKMSDRQVYVWDTANLATPLKTNNLDTSSGVVMPFYDGDSKMLYLAGKGYVWLLIVFLLFHQGTFPRKDILTQRHALFKSYSDGNIRYYEYENDEMFSLSEYGSNVPQRGLGFMPKRGLNINDCEIARAYKVSNGIVEPISFTVPRKVSF